MIIEVDLDFLVKHKMTIEQYFVCYVLYEDKNSIVNGQRTTRKSGQPIAAIYKYSENVGGIKRSALEDLMERGYLELTGDKLTPDMLEVTDKFHREVFTHWSNFEQLFEIYPSRTKFEAGGSSVSLKSLDKPIEEMGKYYSGIVRTKKKHREILEITAWAKDRDLLKMGIQKYVYSQYWNQLENEYETGADDDDIEVLI